LILPTSLLAGSVVENLNYELPDVENPAVVVFCASSEAMEVTLDNLSLAKQMYNEFGIMPNDCYVFLPPLAVGEHSISHLYVTDDGNLYGILDITGPEGSLYSYVDEETLVKKESY